MAAIGEFDGPVLDLTADLRRYHACHLRPSVSSVVNYGHLWLTVSEIAAIGELDVRVLDLTADSADLRRYHACHLRPSVSSVVNCGHLCLTAVICG